MAYVARELPGELSQEQVREQFAEWQKEETEFRIANGIEFPSEVEFSGPDPAADWLKNHAETWGPALAVRVIQPRQDTGVVQVESKTGVFNYRVVNAWNPNPTVYVQLAQRGERRLRTNGQQAMAVIAEFRRVTGDSGKTIWLVGVWSPH